MLVYWERGEQAQGRRSLTAAHVPGIPATTGELLSYGHWLEPHSARTRSRRRSTSCSEGPGVQHHLEDQGERLPRSGWTRRRWARSAAVARRRRLPARPRPYPGRASASRPRHPRHPRDPQCAAKSGVDQGRQWPAVLGQCRLRGCRGGQQRRRGHRTPRRIARDAPAAGAGTRTRREPRLSGEASARHSRSPRHQRSDRIHARRRDRRGGSGRLRGRNPSRRNSAINPPPTTARSIG